MKKILVGILSMVLVFSVQAQNSKQVLKDAKKALDPFFEDMAANAESARQVIADLEANFGTPEKPDQFIKKGELYMKISEEEEKMSILNPSYQRLIPDAPMLAFKSLKNAMGTKKEKDALKKLTGVMGSLTILGNSYFDLKDYTNAFQSFNNVLQIHEILVSHDKDSNLENEEMVNQQKFYTLVAGMYSDEISNEQVLPLIKDLFDAKYDHSFVYEAYFKAALETDEETAIKALEEGRATFPDDAGLLYAEINYYLQKGDLNKPISRIKEAIEKDPENISLYTTMGNVYDQLNQQSRESGDSPKADEYFNLAKKYFDQAIEKDPENLDATYSVGALYYNKAASMTKIVNELSSDYSAEGGKKYEAAIAQMNALFEQAKPFFEKVLTLDANNQNSMIALKEIYARMGDFEKSNELKDKLESLGG